MPRSAPRHSVSRVAAHDDLARLTVPIEGLPNRLSLQLYGTPLGGSRAFSLYALYREGTMTFDAVIRFDRGACGRRLAEVLRAFVASERFRTAVADPLVREVLAHFRR